MESDKTFELLTKMYGQINNRFDSMEKSMSEVKHDMDSVKQDIKNIYTKIEVDIDDKLKSLVDGYKVNYEITAEIRCKVEENSKGIYDLNMGLSEIKDDVNYIANKTIIQDGRLNRLDKEIKNHLNI
ncbi:hypothetical protein [Clostridium akagii]|uniref:hypothetical protein n=1 Tax=Clostridium akagii TaxID=91623 RepID=UPI00047BA235|nr:hypothetical protein [Clostridium akagii]